MLAGRGATLVAATLLMIISSAIVLANPWFASKLASGLSQLSESSFAIPTLILFWFALIVLQAWFGYISNVWVADTSEIIKTELWGRIHSHVLHQPVDILEQRKRGDTISFYSNDVALLGGFLTQTLTGIVPQMLTFCGAALLLFITDYKIGLMVFAVILPLVLVAKLLSRNIRQLAKTTFESMGGVFNVIEEQLQQVTIIKAFTLEGRSSELLKEKLDSYKNNYFNYNRRQFLIMPVIKTLGSGFILAAIWFFSNAIINNELTIEKIIKIAFYGFLIIRPVSTMAATFGRYQAALAADSRIYELLEVKQENYGSNRTIANSRNAVHDDSKGLAIQFQNVSYSYDGVNSILDNFNLTIEPGETIALTGPNGCGKSTTVKLIMQFIRPTEGMIFLDSEDISKIPVNIIRSRIGYVPQSSHMFAGSVRDNLKIGNLDASDEELVACLEAIGASKLLIDLPAGLDTLTGEQGTLLSGGQSQRIALARALLARPPLLILDEATSMFDPAAEIAYVNSCRDWLKHATVILITHRPASLALANREFDMSDLRSSY